MRTSAQLRGAATAWGAMSFAALLVAIATFPYGLLRSYSSQPPAPETYAPAPIASPPVEAPPEPARVAGVAAPASQTEIWFSGAQRLVRLGGIYPIRPDDPSFLANNQYAYDRIFSGQIECVETANGGSFRCQNSKGEDVANLLVNEGLASYREVAASAAPESVSTSAAVSFGDALASATPIEVSNIRWRRRPGERDFARRYPRAALEANQIGRVTMNCLIQQGGSLNCSVAEEEPAGAGFGQAAQELSEEFRAGARAEDGQRTAGRSVRLTMAFQPDD
jgi:hypothetical protein